MEKENNYIESTDEEIEREIFNQYSKEDQKLIIHNAEVYHKFKNIVNITVIEKNKIIDKLI